MNKFSNIILTFTFFLVILFPWFSPLLPRQEMSGVFENTEKPSFSQQALLDGSFQNSVENYLWEHLPGREYMIKTKNQIVFDIFKKSPVEKVIIGKDNQMFSRSFINLWYQLTGPTTDTFIEELTYTISQFRDMMNKHNIKLALYITPSKARYYTDDIPDKYRWSAPDYPEKSAYEKFMLSVTPLNIPVFDSIAYLDSVRDGKYLNDFPLFNKTGTHWTQSTGAKVSKELGDFLEVSFDYNLPEMSVEIIPTDSPVYPDADIFGILNMYTKAYDTYTQPIITITEPGENLPRLLCRGGSFMGQSLAHLTQQGYFSNFNYMENTQIFKGSFANVSTFHDYREIDLKEIFSNTDLVILEVNEASIDVMGFGFMEYVLEHENEIFY